MISIAVIFHRLGPYHWARLNSIGALLPTLGVELFGETSDYGWDKISGRSAFQRVTAFSGGNNGAERPTDLVRRIHQILDEYHPDVVAIPGWSEKGALAALSWCLKKAKPVVVMSDSQVSDEPRLWPKEMIKGRLVQMCSTGLAGGIRHADYLAALGLAREHIFIGYDVVDNDHFAAGSDAARRDAVNQRRQLNLPDNYFFTCSRFITKKNLRRLLEAYDGYRLLAGPDAWKLVLLGDGPLKPQLLDQIEQRGLAAEVLVRGFIQYEELPAYYGLAGALIHASTTEQWGLVVNEAMASGLPVIVSNRCGCLPELVAEGKNGFSFDPVHTPGLIQLLRRVAAKDFDRAAMGEAGRQMIARWSLETFAANLKRAAEAALETPRRRTGFLDHIILRALLQR
jgi:1,2-diacylglycerol 3-alpha-glucosyltransferase